METKKTVSQNAKLVVKDKKFGVRGSEDAKVMIEILIDEWDQVQEQFKNKQEDEQEQLLLFLESVNEDLPDCLFGDNSAAEDVQKFVNGKKDEEQDVIAKAIFEILDIQKAEN